MKTFRLVFAACIIFILGMRFGRSTMATGVVNPPQASSPHPTTQNESAPADQKEFVFHYFVELNDKVGLKYIGTDDKLIFDVIVVDDAEVKLSSSFTFLMDNEETPFKEESKHTVIFPEPGRVYMFRIVNNPLSGDPRVICSAAVGFDGDGNLIRTDTFKLPTESNTPPTDPSTILVDCQVHSL